MIRLTPGSIGPEWRRGCVNEFRGGPETLLRWLETQLGLPAPTSHNASRIAEYAAAFDALPDDATISVKINVEQIFKLLSPSTEVKSI